MAQTTAVEDKPVSLQENYYLIKTKAESYQDYKVIKEYVLDGVWKMAIDSLGKRKKQLAEANVKLDSLQKGLNSARALLKQKTDSMSDIEYAGGHIKVLGKNFAKGTFLALVAITLVALAGLILIQLARMNQMQRFVNESKLIITNINNEFEDYKHKALEKQAKLARELQTERNKLMELKQRSNQ